MTDTQDPKKTEARTWFEKLSDAFLREPKDKTQLVNLLRYAKTRELLDTDALAMIEGVLQVSEMQVRDIMIPRSQIVVVPIDKPAVEFLPQIIESGHSRFPVIGENRDEVIGILMAKDLLKYTFNLDTSTFSLQDLIRPAVFVPESKRLDSLLKEFRQKHNHMAIVVDEYGGVAGLVTIEDVLEQIVGEIEDEFDVEEDQNIKQQGEKRYIIKALTPIEEFNDHFKTELSDEEFDTIGGYITHAFGHLPNKDETLIIENMNFKVMNADNRRILLLELIQKTK